MTCVTKNMCLRNSLLLIDTENNNYFPANLWPPILSSQSFPANLFPPIFSRQPFPANLFPPIISRQCIAGKIIRSRHFWVIPCRLTNYAFLTKHSRKTNFNGNKDTQMYNFIMLLESIREEFKRSNFGLHCDDPSVFGEGKVDS